MIRQHYFERVSSTMDVIHRLAGEGAEAGTAVIAGEQLEGRGSRGRAWRSPPGGLWLSVLFRPSTAAGVEVTSLRVGLAVAESIEAYAGCRIGLKWPNDIILDGRKLGGVLCEARWQGDTLGWIAVGIGVNVRNRVPTELAGVAVSLAHHRPDAVADDLADPVVAALRDLDLGAGQLSAAEMSRFARRDWLRGRRVTEPAVGTAMGIHADGALLIRPPQGPDISLRSGPVELAAVSHSR
ncbi:MAG TPA: biotin--[acetyl-CoA-carboxylase] ligase [Gemmatimonadales bacterium]